MKNKIIALTAALSMLGGAVTAFPAMAAGTADLILNGNMELHENLEDDPTKPRILYWNQSGLDQNRTYYDGSAEGANIGDNASGILKCTGRWNEASAPRFFLENNGKKLEENVEYTATAKVYSEEPARIKIAVAAKINCNGMDQEGHAHYWGHPDQVYGENTITTKGGQWETITLKFTPKTVYSSDKLPTYEGETLTFDGTFLSVQTLDPESGDFNFKKDFYVDDVSLTAPKAMPASFTATVEKAEVKNGTGDLENTVATGFQATIKNTGDTEGSFNTVNWKVTFNNETKTTGDKAITKVTLPKDADITIALIIDGLDGADATAEVSVK